NRFPHARVFRAQLLEVVEQISGVARRPTTRDDALAVAARDAATPEARPRSKAMWLVVAMALVASAAALVLTVSNASGPPSPASTASAELTAAGAAQPLNMPDPAALAV